VSDHPDEEPTAADGPDEEPGVERPDEEVPDTYSVDEAPMGTEEADVPDEPEGSDDPDDPESPDDSDSPRVTVEQAVEQIRRESLKAASIPALIDGVLVLLVANLLLTVFDVGVPGPSWTRMAAPAVVGLVAAGTEFALRARRPPIEQFEGVPPAVRGRPRGPPGGLQ